MHRPSFYAERFFKFMSSTVFRKSSCEPPPVGEGQGTRAGKPLPGVGARVRTARRAPVSPDLRAWAQMTHVCPVHTGPAAGHWEGPAGRAAPTSCAVLKGGAQDIEDGGSHGVRGHPRTDLVPFLPDSAALKSSPSKKGRGALLAVKPLGPTAAFSASQIPSEREDVQYDLRGARSYPTLEDEGDLPTWALGTQEASP